MVNNKISENKTLYIDNGVIKDISDSDIEDIKGVKVIEANSMYAMPGLINMHTHLGDNKDDLLLYLVNGVTTIRNMWGYENWRLKHWLLGLRVFKHLELKRKISKGEIIGPRIYTAGAIIDGSKPFLPKSLPLCSVNKLTNIKDIIKTQINKGYDFIKIYHMLSKQNFEDIIRIAKEHNIPVAGHVPDSVGIKRVLESGIKSIEHLYGFINPYQPQLNIKKENIKKLANLAAINEVWNCPTLIAHQRLANIKRQADFENENQMNYVSKRNKKAMRFLIKASNKLYQKKNVKGNHEYMNDLYHVIKVLKSEGAGILLGTDKAVPYVVAGFSEHLEMKLLSKAGLSNYEVIKSATVNAAKCLNKLTELGTLQVGKKADLVITKHNPLTNLKTIFNHHGVVKDGVWYSRSACNNILKEIRSRANG